MAHIAYVSIGMGSTIHGSVELARRLKLAGHEVTFLSHVDIRRDVASQGCNFVLLERNEQLRKEAHTLASPRRTSPWQLSKWVSWFRQRRRIRRASLDSDEIESRIGSLSPDLLILDIEAHYAIITTAKLGLPRVLVSFWFDVFYAPDVPPMSTPLFPPTNQQEVWIVRKALRKARMDHVQWRWRNRLNKRHLARPIRPVSCQTVSFEDLRALARSHNFSLPRETTTRQWQRPLTYTRLPIMNLNLEELDFPHQTPANMHYVGPLVNVDREEPRAKADTQAVWRAFLGNRDSNESRPLIYCSLGTYIAGNTNLLAQLMTVLRKRSDWDLVLGLGERTPRDSLGAIPGNVLALDWAPQAAILRHASCAITHGGISTINECLKNRVPMILHSTKTVDQPGCVARMVFHGIAVSGDMNHDDASIIEHRVEQTLQDSGMREKIEHFNELVQRHDENNTAVALIESLLSRS